MYARRMREKQYLTMFDPFQHRYGNMMVVLLYLAAMAADIFWSASILVALGKLIIFAIRIMDFIQ